MYNYKSISLCVLLVAFLGCALVEGASSTVSLHVFSGSSVWWVAVQPQNDGSATSKIEMHDSRSTTFTTMQANPDWGFYSYSSPTDSGFKAPLTFRLTSKSGSQITVTMNTLAPDAVVDSGASYSGSSSSSGTATAAPTTKPTTKPTSAPATSAPTTAPTTPKPTTKPTTAPTTKPTSSGASTTAPTTKPTTKPTTAPTTKPSSSSSGSTTTDACAIVPTSTEPVQLLVPLYVYPGADWDSLVDVASKVKIVAIINPNSGPLSTVDSTYSTYMTKLHNAGIEMVGYVYTSYGTRAMASVQADIDTYASKYPLVTGIFFDEGANDAGHVSWYTQAYNYAMSKSGYTRVVINPGVAPDEGYLAASTNIVIYEDYASSLSAASFPSWVKCAPSTAQKSGWQYKFSGIVHTAAAGSEASYISSLHNMGVGMVYVTDGVGGCCTYNTLTSYFAAEASAVESLNA